MIMDCLVRMLPTAVIWSNTNTVFINDESKVLFLMIGG